MPCDFLEVADQSEMQAKLENLRRDPDFSNPGDDFTRVVGILRMDFFPGGEGGLAPTACAACPPTSWALVEGKTHFPDGAISTNTALVEHELGHTYGLTHQVQSY